MRQGKCSRCFHVNDYPYIPRETVTDGDRVFPGDGVAPLTPIFRYLRDGGFNGHLSLELFNTEYERTMDPLTIARTGLDKLRACVRQAFGVGTNSVLLPFAAGPPNCIGVGTYPPGATYGPRLGNDWAFIWIIAGKCEYYRADARVTAFTRFRGTGAARRD